MQDEATNHRPLWVFATTGESQNNEVGGRNARLLITRLSEERDSLRGNNQNGECWTGEDDCRTPTGGCEINWDTNTYSFQCLRTKLRSEVGILTKRYYKVQGEIDDMVVRLQDQPSILVTKRLEVM